jgi:hypothetical protein
MKARKARIEPQQWYWNPHLKAVQVITESDQQGWWRCSDGNEYPAEKLNRIHPKTGALAVAPFEGWIEFDARQFRKALKTALVFRRTVKRGEKLAPDYPQCGVMLRRRADRLEIYSTDGTALASLAIDCDGTSLAAVLVTFRTAKALLAQTCEGLMRLDVSEKRVIWHCGMDSVSQDVSDNRYPNVDQVMPRECQGRESIDVKDFRKRIREATTSESGTQDVIFCGVEFSVSVELLDKILRSLPKQAKVEIQTHCSPIKFSADNSLFLLMPWSRKGK